MTITDTTPALPDYRAATDDDLAVMLTGSDGETFAAIAAELDRRDRADRMAKARRRLGEIRSEGDTAAFAQYLEADAACRGNLLSRAGIAAGITDEQALWRMPEEQAQRYASEELRDYWLYVAPRITSGAYVRQQAAQSRTAQAQARHAREEEGNDDEQHIYRDHGTQRREGPELAGNEPRALRCEPPAPQAPQAGAGGPVRGGGRGPGEGEDSEDGPGTGGPGGPVRGDGELVSPGDDPGEPGDEYAPGDLKFILDEAAEFAGRYVSATSAQIDTMTLFATATNALGAFPAFGELLFAAKTELAGKTTGMDVTAALCANPVSAKGTVPGLQSEIAAAANEPEKPRPVLKYDEIGGLYGQSGLNRGGNWVLDDIFRDGYKNGATRKWSVNRSSQEFSIHVPVIMTGRGTCLPRDIRSRTIVITMEPGKPAAYFDLREAQPEAEALATCIRQAVLSRIKDIAAFRARGVHPQLRDRKLEVWEPLFAVAYILGGQEWLNRCLAAFRELALSDAGEVILTPRQQVLRDAAQIIAGPLEDMAATGFVGGLALADEMRRLDNPLYGSRSEAGMAKLISDAMPVPTTQKRVDGKPVRGYFAHQITQAWEAVRPAELEDASIAEEENPFAVTGDTEDSESGEALTWDVTGEVSEAGSQA